MNDLERRAFVVDALKVERREKEMPKIVGHAAVFNQETEIGSRFNEVVLPGAFTRTIANDDIVALFNHDENIVLGRKSAGTLKLAEDEIGLRIEVTPPDTQSARDLLVSIERGDVRGMSFGFIVPDRRNDQQWDESGGKLKRILKQVRVLDVSPVTFPAYEQTDIALRSLEEHRKAVAADAGLNTVNGAALVRSKTQRLRDRGQ